MTTYHFARATARLRPTPRTRRRTQHGAAHGARVAPLVLPRWVEVALAKWVNCTNYDDYMRSFIWRSKRWRALERAKFACQVCNTDKNLHVHHREYALPYGTEPDDDLTVLCKTCHERYHKEK